jgi:hypothetical protein
VDSTARHIENMSQAEHEYWEELVERKEHPERFRCSRTACQVELPPGQPHYLIYNQPSTGIPRPYCVRCGRRIMDYNEHDEIKLRCEIMNPPGPSAPASSSQMSNIPPGPQIAS